MSGATKPVSAPSVKPEDPKTKRRNQAQRAARKAERKGRKH